MTTSDKVNAYLKSVEGEYNIFLHPPAPKPADVIWTDIQIKGTS